MNLHLRSDSAAIDAGTNTTVIEMEYDLDGKARIYNETVDIGAYEYQGDRNDSPLYYSSVVNTLNDSFDYSDNEWSLREAIYWMTEYTTITFAQNLAGTINLSLGQLVINRALAIDGANRITIDGNKKSRVIEVQSGTTDSPVLLNGLTIQGGRATNGGGIYNSGVLTITNSTITDNHGRESHMGLGAGIYSVGFLTVDGCTISDNADVVLGGGGIAAEGTLIVKNSLITRNSAGYRKGSDGMDRPLHTTGGGIYHSNGELFIENSIISENKGGGMIVASTGVVKDSTISGNVDEASSDAAGGISFYGNEKDGNEKTLTLINCTIFGNRGYSGGGIYSELGNLIVDSCAIYGNSAMWGGGIGTFWDFNVELNNCTIVGNAASYGGGIYGPGTYGGGFISHNSIIAKNSASNGNDVRGTVIAFNTLSSFTAWENASMATNYEYDSTLPLFSRIPVVIDETTTGYNFNPEDWDLRLARSSQAIDKGDNQYVTEDYDIAGDARIKRGTVDLGAYEYGMQAPKGLTATVSTSTVTLGWQAVEGTTKYVVQRSTNGTDGWAKIGESTTTSFMDTNLSSRAYYYRIYSINATGEESDYSSIASVSIEGIVLETPTLKVISTGTSSVVIQVEGVPNASRYVLQYSTNLDFLGISNTKTKDVSVNENTIDGLESGTTYYFRVKAVGSGMYSSSSYSSSVRTTTGKKEIQNLSLNVNSDTSITLKWDSLDGDSKYIIERLVRESWKEISVSTDASYTDEGLSANTTYSYRITAVNDSGIRIANSAELSATTLLTRPTNVVAEAVSSTEILLKWKAVSGATGYKVERSTDNSTWTTLIDSVSATSFTNAGLTAEKLYYYRVTAINDTNTSKSSLVVSVTTLKTSPEGFAENYVVIFSGGGDKSNNHSHYYDTITDFYTVCTASYSVPKDHIYVLYADGADPGKDQYKNGVFIDSDMTFANGSYIHSATLSNFEYVMSTVGGLMDNNDHLMVYVFDHGNGNNDNRYTNEELIIGWGDLNNDPNTLITGTEFSNAMLNVTQGYVTIALNQCFAGGILDNLFDPKTGKLRTVDPDTGKTRNVVKSIDPNKWFGMSATNHYEFSWDNDFAQGINNALKSELTSTQDVYQNAYDNDIYATTGGWGELDGKTVWVYEHPWCVGSDFRIFATPQQQISPNALVIPEVLNELQFSEYNSSDNSVLISWVDNSSNETGFQVERSTDDGNTWILLETLAANTTQYTCHSVEQDTTYHFRIRSFNDGGDSEWTYGTFIAPAAPISPNKISFGELNITTLPVFWEDSSDDETGYRLQYSTDNGVTWTNAGTFAANVTSTTVSNIDPAKSYQFRVQAYHAYGASEWIEDTYLPYAVPESPTDMIFSAYEPSEKTVQLTWTDHSNNETRQRLEYSKDGGTTWTLLKLFDANITSATCPEIDANSVYQFRVRAENNNGSSAWAVSRNFSVDMIPSAPSDIVFDYTPGDRVATMSWTDSSDGESGFQVESSFNGENWFYAGECDSDKTSLSLGVTLYNVTYYYRVRAFNEYGASDWVQNSFQSAEKEVPTIVNQFPVAVDDSAEVDRNGEIEIDVLANDTDADGDLITLLAVEQAKNGAVVIRDGKTVYTPNAGFYGTDSFEYTISDGKGGTDVGTVAVTVENVVVEIQNTKMNVSWAAVDGAKTYTLEYKLNTAAKWSKKVVNTNTASISGKAGCEYDIRVTAQVEGAQAFEQSAIILSKPTLKADKSSIKDDTFQIAVTNWTAKSNLAAEAKTVKVQVGKEVTSFALSETATVSGMKVTFDNGVFLFVNAVKSTSYKVSVQFSDGRSESQLSSTCSVKTLGAPYLVPTNVRAEAVGDTQIAVTWDAVKGKNSETLATAYTVQYSTDGGKKWKSATTRAAGTSYTVTKLKGATSYLVRVFATKDRNFLASDPSTTTSVVTWFPMPKISSVVSKVVSQAELKWSVTSQAEQYELQYRVANTETWQSVEIPQPAVGVRTVACTLENLISGAKYEFRLKVCTTPNFHESLQSAVKLLSRVK